MKKRRSVPLIVLACINILFLTRCAQDAPYKILGTTTPEPLNDGWIIASPEEVGLSPAVLDRIHIDLASEDQYYNAKSFLIVKDGKLVFEYYVRSMEDRDHYGSIQSVTKSITSLLFGIVLSEGDIDSLDQKLYDVCPDKFPSDTRKQDITLRHLLTMTSGLTFDNDVFSVETYVHQPRDPIRNILEKPLYAAPGDEFYYRDCDPHLISYAIQRLTGRTLEQLGLEYLFGPLGITDYYWESDHKGVTMGAVGLHLKPRDMAKIGQLVLDGGKWHGESLVDSTWLALSTGKQVKIGEYRGSYGRSYGFYWWVLPDWQAFTASGHGGNFILVVPSSRMLVVMTSLSDTDDDIVGTRLDMFEDLIQGLLE
ncbi:MAG: serine hydrolase [Fidelibacterota bacterium]|nr:MAG: serine hydrolase [Candidatus Neomarinimicrobiota bacterium]